MRLEHAKRVREGVWHKMQAINKSIDSLESQLNALYQNRKAVMDNITDITARVHAWEQTRDRLRGEVGYLLKLKKGDTDEGVKDVLNRV